MNIFLGFPHFTETNRIGTDNSNEICRTHISCIGSILTDFIKKELNCRNKDLYPDEFRSGVENSALHPKINYILLTRIDKIERLTK